MGKVKKSRQKFHFPPVKVKKPDIDANDTPAQPVPSEEAPGWTISMKDDIFQGMDIQVDNLKGSLAADNDRDDAKSVRSVARTYRSLKKSLMSDGRIMKKEDKKKLRHGLFLSTINQFYEARDKRKKKGKSTAGVKISELDEALPKVDMIFHKSCSKIKEKVVPSVKKRGIKKAKHRMKELEENVVALKTLMTASKPNVKLVTEQVEKKVLNMEI